LDSPLNDRFLDWKRQEEDKEIYEIVGSSKRFKTFELKELGMFDESDHKCVGIADCKPKAFRATI